MLKYNEPDKRDSLRECDKHGPVKITERHHSGQRHRIERADDQHCDHEQGVVQGEDAELFEPDIAEQHPADSGDREHRRVVDRVGRDSGEAVQHDSAGAAEGSDRQYEVGCYEQDKVLFERCAGGILERHGIQISGDGQGRPDIREGVLHEPDCRSAEPDHQQPGTLREDIRDHSSARSDSEFQQ